MNKIKIGLIGCGKQGEKHLASLKALPNVEVILTDVQPELAKSLAEKHNVAWKKNPDDIFEDGNISAVLICTPTPSHAELIKKALLSGKEVFCEKPLCTTLEEASALKDLEKETGHYGMVGYIYRYVPVFEEGHRLFSKYRINEESLILGKPLSAFFRLGGRGGHQVWKHKKNQGGGAINEMLVHMIDLANWYFGPLREVEVVSNKIELPTRVIQGEVIEADAEDFVLIRCTGFSGIEIFCQADLITPAFSQYVEIQCENGTFMGSIQPEIPSFLFLKEGRGGYETGKTIIQYGKRKVLDIQMAHFVQTISQGIPPDRNRIEDSIELMKVIEQIKGKQ
ncbi:Gfo/Idh/MocA family oxidoreductase [Candidatus Sumerlaeota bacterium]|nr:Gfo/Idh/MocA family oxidoreductase [Candidatus Sumerlaeota bacterium]